MAANNGGHISFVGKAAAGDHTAAKTTVISPVLEKGIAHDLDSVYDEEDVLETKSSDFKHKQVGAQTMRVLGLSLTR